MKTRKLNFFQGKQKYCFIKVFTKNPSCINYLSYGTTTIFQHTKYPVNLVWKLLLSLLDYDSSDVAVTSDPVDC